MSIYIYSIIYGKSYIQPMQVAHAFRFFIGHGFGYIFENIVPRLRMRGVSDRDIELMLETHPRTLLTLAPPKE